MCPCEAAGPIRRACACLLLASALGCARPAITLRPAIPTGEAEPLKAQFAYHASRTVRDRHLLLPVRYEDARRKSSFLLGSFYSSSVAWTGSGFGTRSSGRYWLNLAVMDLFTGDHRRVFDRQVALISWDASWKGVGELWFDGLLVLSARAEDTNADERIDENDAILLYTYDLSSHELVRISPEGYSLQHIERQTDTLILFLTAPDRDQTASIYAYRPSERQGSFYARELRP